MNLFVTGTDTNIGKTVVSTILCLKFGHPYWKPIQSGILPITDTQWVAERIGKENTYPEAYSLTQPLSPHLSARLDHKHISLDTIVQQTPKRSTIIEGAGGVLVPLNDTSLMIDLISRLTCKVVIVARAELGTLNHTLLTLEALRRRNIKPSCVVMVGEENIENRKSIEYFGSIQVAGHIPRLSKLDRETLLNLGPTLDLENTE